MGVKKVIPKQENKLNGIEPLFEKATFFPLGPGYIIDNRGKQREVGVGDILISGTEEVPQGAYPARWMANYTGRPIKYLRIEGTPEKVEIGKGYVEAVIGNEKVRVARKGEPPFYEISFKSL